MIKNQIVNDKFGIYESDSMYFLPKLKKESIDLSVYSPPFVGLYKYSSHSNDLSNCESSQQFLEQYEFFVKEIARVTKPGRITAVHCTDIIKNTTSHTLWDFPHEIIKLHLKHGFTYNNRITIWKEPLEVRTRTMVNSLKHKQIVEDSTKCYTAIPDYVLVFRKGGENKTPVVHPCGIQHYAGETPLLPAMEKKYGKWEHIKKKYEGWTDHKTNKKAHIIWQRYASSVWDDVRNKNVLTFKPSRDEDDEKHVHPLQLDVIDRLVELYSNPGETLLTPFMGVGSEIYSAVSLGRKAIGIELKGSYYKQAVLNLSNIESRFILDSQIEIAYE